MMSKPLIIIMWCDIDNPPVLSDSPQHLQWQWDHQCDNLFSCSACGVYMESICMFACLEMAFKVSEEFKFWLQLIEA